MKRVILVGEQFSEFGNKDKVLTLPTLRCALEQNNVSEIILGQGLAYEEVKQLGELLQEQKIPIDYVSGDELAPLSLTHKRCLSNVLITTPRSMGEHCYTAALALNDKMDRLLDHVTGTHLNGMVLIEAGRQLTIATGELEFNLAAQDHPWGFVWTGMDIGFSRYAFPVPTNIQLRIGERPGSTTERPKCTAMITFIQADKEVCSAAIHYDLLPMRTLRILESKAASQLLQSLTQDPVGAKGEALVCA